MLHILDNPVWQALTGRQSAVAIAHGAVRRYEPDISPFAAMDACDDASVADLAGLVLKGETVLLVRKQANPFISMPAFSVSPFAAVQMVMKDISEEPSADDVIDLSDDDAPDMLALATRTKPGPFLARTHRLGRFIGIRKQGKLVAMAGERFKLDGFTEVSGVCTDPDWQGRGYAGILSRIIAARIRQRGEIPILHAFSSNEAAIRLYQSIGFTIRERLEGAVLKRL